MRNIFYNIRGDLVGEYLFDSYDLNGNFVSELVPCDQFFTDFEGTVFFDIQGFFDSHLDCMRVAVSDLFGNPNVGFNNIPVASVVVDRNVFFDTNSLALAFGIQTSEPSPLQSLNGNGCEYADGDMVNVATRSEIFIVSSSFFVMLSNNTYSPCYNLVTIPTNKTLIVPEALLSLYVEPVV